MNYGMKDKQDCLFRFCFHSKTVVKCRFAKFPLSVETGYGKIDKIILKLKKEIL